MLLARRAAVCGGARRKGACRVRHGAAMRFSCRFMPRVGAPRARCLTPHAPHPLVLCAGVVDGAAPWSSSPRAGLCRRLAPARLQPPARPLSHRLAAPRTTTPRHARRRRPLQLSPTARALPLSCAPSPVLCTPLRPARVRVTRRPRLRRHARTRTHITHTRRQPPDALHAPSRARRCAHVHGRLLLLLLLGPRGRDDDDARLPCRRVRARGAHRTFFPSPRSSLSRPMRGSACAAGNT
jgi:hypothetical protein